MVISLIFTFVDYVSCMTSMIGLGMIHGIGLDQDKLSFVWYYVVLELGSKSYIMIISFVPLHISFHFMILHSLGSLALGQFYALLKDKQWFKRGDVTSVHFI